MDAVSHGASGFPNTKSQNSERAAFRQTSQTFRKSRRTHPGEDPCALEL